MVISMTEASERIKQWITVEELSIHDMGKTESTTHWIEAANIDE